MALRYSLTLRDRIPFLQTLRAAPGPPVELIDGRVRHSLLLEIYTHSGVGTQIVLRNGQ